MELLCVSLLLAVLGAMSAPTVLATLARARTLAAARYVAARMQGARVQAAATGRAVGIHVAVQDTDVRLQLVLDGNRNGVRTADIEAGVDTPVDADVALGDLFPGVRAGSPDGDIALGAHTSIYSFSPAGTSSSGTLYLRGPADARFAVRVLGATGRVRVLRFQPDTSDWVDVR